MHVIPIFLITRSTTKDIYNYVQKLSVPCQCSLIDTPNEYFRDERNEAIQAVRNFTQGHVKKDGIGKTVSGNGSKIVNLQTIMLLIS